MDTTDARVLRGSEVPEDFKPPYVSFSMLENTLERMRVEGVPARVDRSYLGTASGSAKAQFLAAAKALELLDEQSRPTRTLHALVPKPEDRPGVFNHLLHRFYAPVIALGTNATQSQLEETFRAEYGISGSTVRKAISFYLAAAKFADVAVSPHFSTPRIATAGQGTRRRRPARAVPEPEPQPASTRPAPVETSLPGLIAALVRKLPPQDQGWDEAGARQWLSLVAPAIAYDYDLDLGKLQGGVA